MKILFLGTPDFAAASLEKLYENNFDICGVFTQPDRPKNRGMKIEYSPVKSLALSHDTPVFQPVKMRDGSALKIVEELSPDIIVTVAYGRILPKEILDYPRLGCINIHGSILPKYRGSAPIQWSVLNGDKVTGVTAMYMDVEMDTGDIISIRETEILENETSGELFERLAQLGAELLCDTLRDIENGNVSRIKQDESLATYAPPLTKDMSPIDWNNTAEKILNQIRGLNPWPVATAEIGGVKFKIFSAVKAQAEGEIVPGKIMCADKRGLGVYCADGAVMIKVLQAPGGKKMAAADYLRGHPIKC